MPAPTPDQLEALASLLSGRRWLALTGAGLSTDSGIPDYRGPEARASHPIQYADFLRHPAARRRYWARSMMGWRSFGVADPNDGHRALATMGVPVITQNVDDLHRVAGSERVVDLHGLISRVVCLDCGAPSGRADLQTRLEAANPHVTGRIPAGDAELRPAGDAELRPAGHAELRPDGDADIADPVDFTVPACEACGGTLKPDVVFFGESVPKSRVEESYELVDGADALVVAGSSLAVMSGLRFVRHAARRGLPVVIVNRGATRGDELATLRLDTGTTPTLKALAGLLVPVAS